jgi:hypothetical protein
MARVFCQSVKADENGKTYGSEVPFFIVPLLHAWYFDL